MVNGSSRQKHLTVYVDGVVVVAAAFASATELRLGPTRTEAKRF